jgi:NADH:ubiquinone oxidoreductase subunit D
MVVVKGARMMNQYLREGVSHMLVPDENTRILDEMNQLLDEMNWLLDEMKTTMNVVKRILDGEPGGQAMLFEGQMPGAIDNIITGS